MRGRHVDLRGTTVVAGATIDPIQEIGRFAPSPTGYEHATMRGRWMGELRLSRYTGMLPLTPHGGFVLEDLDAR